MNEGRFLKKEVEYSFITTSRPALGLQSVIYCRYHCI